MNWAGCFCWKRATTPRPSAACPHAGRCPAPAVWTWAPVPGSVARWLAAQAGPAGQVVATDADPRFLADAGKAGVEVRRHDILADPLEPAAYDVVHCRALLLHLADPQQALRSMAAAVQPGGWLLIEDADYMTCVAADPAHPRSARFGPGS